MGPDTLNPYAQFSRLQPDANLGNVVLVYHGTFAVPLAAAYSHSATAEGSPKREDGGGNRRRTGGRQTRA